MTKQLDSSMEQPVPPLLGILFGILDRRSKKLVIGFYTLLSWSYYLLPVIISVEAVASGYVLFLIIQTLLEIASESLRNYAVRVIVQKLFQLVSEEWIGWRFFFSSLKNL